jgi:hypothetical protein
MCDSDFLISQHINEALAKLQMRHQPEEIR